MRPHKPKNGLRRVKAGVFLAMPIVSVLIIQAYLLIPGRPYVWGEAKPSEIACVLEGSMTPFGRAMFIAALPDPDGDQSFVQPRKIGLFFLERTPAMLDHGFRSREDGLIHLRLNKRRIWVINPWKGTAKHLADIETQDSFSQGKFPSEEFCVAQDHVWFETFDAQWYTGLFLQRGDSLEEVFRRKDLFRIIGCTEDSAFVVWDEGGQGFVVQIDRASGTSLVLKEYPSSTINFRAGDWEPERVLYQNFDRNETWWYLWDRFSDTAICKEEERYWGYLGCNNAYFLAFDLEHVDGPVTRVEEVDLQDGKMVNSFWVNGYIKHLVFLCPE